MVNIVVVSHSARLAEGVAELAGQMLQNGCRIVLAAGIDDSEHPIGTDAIRVMQAIEEAYTPSGVLLLMDLGSALLSAETALELLDPAMRANVRLCSAPLVEGTLAAAVAASGGASLEETAREAGQALAAKRAQLGEQEVSAAEAARPAMPEPGADAAEIYWTVRNPAGLHARPAARLAAVLAPFHAVLALYKGDRHADPRSLNQIALLQVRQGDEICLRASGEDAPAALQAFEQLARDNFGDALAQLDMPVTVLFGRSVAEATIAAPAWWLASPTSTTRPAEEIRTEVEQERLRRAIAMTLRDLTRLAGRAQQMLGKQYAGIFGAQSMLIDDHDLQGAAFSRIAAEHCSAAEAWRKELDAMAQAYRELDDEYLRARELDVRDVLRRTLRHIDDEPVALPTPDKAVVLLGDELMPSAVLLLDRRLIKGIVLSAGSPVSHSAILAAAMRIPMVVGVGEALHQIAQGNDVVLDAARGEVRFAVQ